MDSSNYQPPVRRSLSDEDLEARVNQAMASRSGIESVMELLVAQEALRAQEDQEESSWIASMETDGSADAVAALQSFLSEKPGYVPTQDAIPEPVAAEAIVESPPPVIPQPRRFNWMNPAPPTPKVEQVDEAPEVIQQPEQKGFSWFTQPEVVVVVVEEVVEEPEVVVVEEVVEEPEVVVVEEVVEEPDVVVVVEEVVEEPEVIVEIEIVEETVVVDLEPVGSESAIDFERLLAAAAAEEELTALEELAISPQDVLTPAESNVLIPSDEHRNRGPLSQLWVWLGLSATIVPVLLVWAIVGLGLSATATAVVLVVGYLSSGTLLAVAAIAGKRSGLSTSTISRSVFGVWGNSIPLSVLFLCRVATTAIIISSFTFLMNGSQVKLPNFQDSLLNVAGINVTVGLMVQSIILFAMSLLVLVRGNVARIIQVLLSLLAFGLVAESYAVIPGGGLIFTTSGTRELLSVEALTGVALILMVNLTLWFALAPNISKAIPMRVRGLKVFSAVMAANFLVPAVVGIAAIFWLGTLSKTAGLGTIQEAVSALPDWAQGSLTSGTAIAIVFAAMLSLRTATLDLVSLFRFKTRIPALLISFFATFGMLVLFAQQPASQEVEYLANLFILIAALSAGWIGILVADISIRKQAYHELSLSRAYGLYSKFNLLSLTIWVLTLVSATAFIPVDLLGFGFMGFQSLLSASSFSVASSAVGFAVTVLVGMILTYAIRIPQIKKQEREVLALESRREQLNDIFVGTE